MRLLSPSSLVHVEIEGVVTERSLNPEILEKQAVGRFKNPLLPPVKILDVQQLGSVSLSEGKKSFTPTDSFRVTFSGSALPHYIELGKLRLPVRLFVPRVMNCQNCKQLGHTASHCGSKARCSKCGEKHEDGACAVTAPKCAYCGGTPPHDLSSCPAYKQRREKLERSLKERSRQSFAEMLKKAMPSTTNKNPFALFGTVLTVFRKILHGNEDASVHGKLLIRNPKSACQNQGVVEKRKIQPLLVSVDMI